jgi:hypothetical protein
MRRFEFFNKIMYLAIALVLMLLAAVLVAGAIWTLVTRTVAGESDTFHLLHSVGLIIISVAVFDVGKFLFEEEVLHDRELRSMREARRSLTKFMTIIIVATSLEALVLVFEMKQEQVSALLYPSVLMGSAILALVGLGVFQWLSSKADALRPWDSARAEVEAQEVQEGPLAHEEVQGQPLRESKKDG